MVQKHATHTMLDCVGYSVKNLYYLYLLYFRLFTFILNTNKIKNRILFTEIQFNDTFLFEEKTS